MRKIINITFTLLLTLLSSCVYSLFPIYTPETVVFKTELLGKWTTEDEDIFLQFEGKNEEEAAQEEEEEEHYEYTLEVKEGFTISSNEPISKIIDGDTIYDQQIIRDHILESISKIENTDDLESPTKGKTNNAIQKLNSKSKNTEFDGTIAVYQEDSYVLTVVNKEKGTQQKYTAHLADIGGDLFLDLFPIVNYSSSQFSENHFPVHTFFKVEVSKNEFRMTPFDLEKLNKLFESNLIRLRHENVEGSILITAQPKELQKFIDKYSDDESVFESTEIYQRI